MASSRDRPQICQISEAAGFETVLSLQFEPVAVDSSAGAALNRFRDAPPQWRSIPASAALKLGTAITKKAHFIRQGSAPRIWFLN